MKDVRQIIEEKVQAQLKEQQETTARTKQIEQYESRLQEAQGSVDDLFAFGKELVEQVDEQALVIQERNKRVGELEELNRNLTGRSAILLGSKATPRIGQLVAVKQPNDANMVYYVGDGVLLGIPDLAAFNSWGFSFAEVMPANAAEQVLPVGGLIPMKQGDYSNPIEQIANTGFSEANLGT